MSQVLTKLLLLLLTLQPAEDHVDQLARQGRLEENAPVRASFARTINAPPARVWGLLTDVNAWPGWQHDIHSVAISGEVRSGTLFTWNGGMEVHSKIMLVEPLREFVWTGTTYRVRAIHRWDLKQLPGDRTFVTSSESMNGFLLPLFYSSKKLEESERHWLDCLKAAAEVRNPAGDSQSDKRSAP